VATRAALYTRVSTEEQAKEGFSLDAQLERLRLYCKAQGWEIAGEYVDEGHSGRTTKRPAYGRMMQESAKWDTMLVLKMDRIHRNSRNFMAMMDRLTKEGKGFASVTESLDTSTAMGRFVMDIIQRIAQLESDQIGERTFVGMEQKAKSRGGSLGKPAPFGYRYGPGQVLQPVPEERPWVAGAFDRFRQGVSKQRIADWLNESGVPTREKAQWTVWSVTHLLTNPTYAGALPWAGQLQVASHEPIVAPKDFDDVQDRITARSPKRRTYRLTRLFPQISH
jgi:site-specific DNA recombinase